MAAAIVGAKNGVALGAKINSENRAQRIAEDRLHQIERAKERNELLQKILEQYDDDHSMTLSKDEMSKVLRDYAHTVHEVDIAPTDLDFIFLFKLWDEIGGNGLGTFDHKEILGCLETWGNFVLRSDDVVATFNCFSEDQPKLSAQDARPCIESLSKKAGFNLPSEVWEWILKSADLDGDGELSRLEAARAMCCMYRWMRKSDPKGDMLRIAAFIKLDGSLPHPKNHKSRSSMCVVN